MDLDPIVPRRPEDAIPRAGPERVIRARPSAGYLRGSAPGLILIGSVVLSLGVALTTVVISSESWLGHRSTYRRVRGYIAAVGLGAPFAGYGLVCLVRAARMRRAARLAAPARRPEVD